MVVVYATTEIANAKGLLLELLGKAFLTSLQARTKTISKAAFYQKKHS